MLAGQLAYSGRSTSAAGKVAKWALRKLAVGSDQTSPGFLPSGWPARPWTLRPDKPPLPLRARPAREGAPVSRGGYVRLASLVVCRCVVRRGTRTASRLK